MAVSERLVLETINRFTGPGGTTGLVSAGAVRDLSIDGGAVRVTLAVPAGPAGATDALKTAMSKALLELEGVERADLTIQPLLSTVEPKGQPSPQTQPEPPPTWADKIKGIRHVVAVASGKGGVGKSTVSTNLALALRKSGMSVGLLDADIYGPSQQLMAGAQGEPEGGADGRIRPVRASGDVRVMSLGFIIEPDQPVIWRGPMLMKALEQLVSDVDWGELDVLVVDLPPGTGDVALTLCQNVPLAGAVIVTTPQDVALIDAHKALNMFRKLEVRVLGLVENMSGFTCPKCGHEEHIFGDGGGKRTADALGIELLGSIPLDPAIVTGGDTGAPIVLDRPDAAAAQAFRAIAESVKKAIDS